MISFADVDLNDSHTSTQRSCRPESPNNNRSLPGRTSKPAIELARGEPSLSWCSTTAPGPVRLGGLTFRVSDNALDFPAKDETLTVTYNVTVTDNNGAKTDQPVIVTIAGTNDAPVLNVDTSGQNGTGLHGISERPGQTNDAADNDIASGTLTFADVDLSDTHTVTKDAPTFAWVGHQLTQGQIDALTAASTLNLVKLDSTGTDAADQFHLQRCGQYF